jgi:hypothetical protein
MANKGLASTLIALLVVVATGSALAQTEASKPAGMKLEQGAQPAQTAPKPMQTASAAGKRPVKMNEDARHCLDLPSTAEIVKCAEPYRY